MTKRSMIECPVDTPVSRLIGHDPASICELIRRERGFEVEGIRQARIEGERSGERVPSDFAAFARRKAGQQG